MDKKTVIMAGAILLLALIACIAIVIAVEERGTIKTQEALQNADSSAEQAKEKAKNEIETTPSGDLIDRSPRAEELTGARDKLIDEFGAESADRIRQILQRDSGQRTP